MNTNTIINELKILNRPFLENNKNGFKVGEKNYIYKIGQIPILLSAPHAVRGYRESKVKASDYLTGALAIYLAHQCRCSYFVRSYNENDDPNFPLGITLSQIENNYLKNLKQFIETYKQILVIDIHGCIDHSQYDCSFWHDHYKTCDLSIINRFESNFKSHHFTIDNGSTYLGGQVTRQCALVTNSFQIEITRQIRTLKLENDALLKSFLNAMQKSILETYDEFIKLEKVRSGIYERNR